MALKASSWKKQKNSRCQRRMPKYNKGDVLRSMWGKDPIISELFVIENIDKDKKIYKCVWCKTVPGSVMKTNLPIKMLDDDEEIQLVCEG